MLRIKFAIMAFTLLSCVSCNQDKDNSDAQLQDVEGLLYYNSPWQRWEILRDSPGIIEFYVVRNYDINLSEESRKEVQAKGICIQSDKIPYTLNDNLPPVPEIIGYYIDLKQLRYK
jgi:hypothetical protein